MSGISPSALFSVTQLSVEICDDIGNSRMIKGTGFWVQLRDRRIFVTNAHNIEPKMKLGADTKFRLNAAAIQMRVMEGDGASNHTWAFRVQDVDCISKHPTADVAIFDNPQFVDKQDVFTSFAFELSDIADQDFLEKRLQAMDVASFIGFPGKLGVAWYDEQWQLPVARTVNIASFPRIAFSNRNIPTADTMLVSGLSFSGSSGSPVVSHLKGGMPGFIGPDYCPPKVIGIMSGHWIEKEQDVFAHSGLSYLTRSTAILEMISDSEIPRKI